MTCLGEASHTFPHIQPCSLFLMVFLISTTPPHSIYLEHFLSSLRFNLNDTLSLMPFLVEAYQHHIGNPFRIQDSQDLLHTSFQSPMFMSRVELCPEDNEFLFCVSLCYMIEKSGCVSRNAC